MAKLSSMRPHARGAKNSLGGKLKTAHLKPGPYSKGSLGMSAAENRQLRALAGIKSKNLRSGAYS